MSEVEVLASNRKAYHDYFISDPMEAGIVLSGTEIKSVRGHHISLSEAYVRPENGEMWLLNAHISRYEPGSYNCPDPVRRRKLLLHRKQIRELSAKVKEKGLTLVPTRIYLKGNRAKVELALGRGKKLYDKRDAIAKRESDRELGRMLKRA